MEPIRRTVPGEKLAGQIDPDLMALKQKFGQDYWELLRKKVLGLGMGIDELIFKSPGASGFAAANCQDCITNCIDCVTGCNASCIFSA